MALFRNEVNKNFTIIGNYILQSTEVSLKTIGMYAKLASLPDNWRFTEEGLVSICKDGLTSVKSALNELEELGLLLRFRRRNQDGTLGESIYYLFATPASNEEKNEIVARYNPMISAIVIEQKNVDEPTVENPMLDYPMLENHEQLNTNILNTKELNTNNKKETYKEKFETFYKAYPRKVGKANVEKWFNKNKPNDKLFDLIMSKLDMFKKSPDWLKQNGQFIPYPTTWLNQKRWEDELGIDQNTLIEDTQDYTVFETRDMTDDEYAEMLANYRKNKGRE